MVQFLLVVRVADTASAVSGILAARGTGLKAQNSKSAVSRCAAIKRYVSLT